MKIEDTGIHERLLPRGTTALIVFLMGVILVLGFFGIFVGSTYAISNSGIYYYTGLSARLLGGSYIVLLFFTLFVTGKYRYLPKLKKIEHNMRKKIVFVLLVVFLCLLISAIFVEI